MNQLTAYHCVECGHYTISKYDGAKCAECDSSLLESMGNATNIDKNRGITINVSVKDTDIFKRMTDVFSALMDDKHTPSWIKAKVQKLIFEEFQRE